MDGALLLIAGNESCPQPQTSEHLAAVEIMRLSNIIILQNKVDLIQESVVINQHEAIKEFIQVISMPILTRLIYICFECLFLMWRSGADLFKKKKIYLLIIGDSC